MAVNLPFVVLGDTWGQHPISIQHLVLRLVETNAVLYVNTVGLRSPRLTTHDAGLVWQKVKGLLAGSDMRHVGTKNLHTCSPFLIPYNQCGRVRRFNKQLLRRHVARQMDEVGLTSPLLLVSYPSGADVVGELGERLLVYYVCDEYAAMPGVSWKYVEDLERILLSRADLIFVSSAALLEKKRGLRTSPVLLPHGVDFEHFHSAAEPLGSMPIQLQNLPRPLLGFFGLLAPWVDMDLLDRVADAFSDASLVLIGPKWFDCQIPKGRRNIHWLGPCPYSELPRFAAHFDVGLIPFRQDTLTSFVNPLKLLEYLALGLPVVSTPLPDLGNYEGLVLEADTPQGFCNHIRIALTQRSVADRVARFVRAEAESWGARADTVLRHIHATLQQRGAV